jgi:hypothetical protein
MVTSLATVTSFFWPTVMPKRLTGIFRALELIPPDDVWGGGAVRREGYPECPLTNPNLL